MTRGCIEFPRYHPPYSAPETSIREEPLDKPNERLFVHINDVPDALDFTIFADTHHLSLDQMRACAQGMEDVAVGA